MAASNGLANGTNKGFAPESDLIIVETDFNQTVNNWKLTIADACDYIFKVADSLGKPAVINLSLGDYYGTHDATDPAAELIETLLDEKKVVLLFVLPVIQVVKVHIMVVPGRR